jgi:hypothetical protein
MANDSQRDKARATFGKTFFENSKALPNPKNAAAALQKRANDRPIPTYKVGGAVKKNKPPQPTAAEREADRKRREEYAKMKVTPENAAAITRGNRAAAIEGGRYKDGGKAKAGAKRAMMAEQDFTGLMRDAAARAAAKGTPVMKQGGATNEYTAKRVMSRIKAGNFKDGGRAELLRDRRMKDIEKDYKIALAKGKNEGVAKAKYEQRMADAADDYAKRTKADRTATRAAEKAAEMSLKEARSTKGMSITRRDMANDINKFFAGKDMTPKAAEPAKAAETAAAKPSSFNAAFKAARKDLGAGKTFTYNGKSYTTNLAGEGRTGTGTGRARTGTGTGTVRAPAAAAAPVAAAAAPAAPAATKVAAPAATAAATKVAAPKGPSTKTALNPNSLAGMAARMFTPEAMAKRNAEFAKRQKAKGYAAGGAGKVRKGMMKGK